MAEAFRRRAARARDVLADTGPAAIVGLLVIAFVLLV